MSNPSAAMSERDRPDTIAICGYNGGECAGPEFCCGHPIDRATYLAKLEAAKPVMHDLFGETVLTAIAETLEREWGSADGVAAWFADAATLKPERSL